MKNLRLTFCIIFGIALLAPCVESQEPTSETGYRIIVDDDETFSDRYWDKRMNLMTMQLFGIAQIAVINYHNCGEEELARDLIRRLAVISFDYWLLTRLIGAEEVPHLESEIPRSYRTLKEDFGGKDDVTEVFLSPLEHVYMWPLDPVPPEEEVIFGREPYTMIHSREKYEELLDEYGKFLEGAHLPSRSR